MATESKTTTELSAEMFKNLDLLRSLDVTYIKYDLEKDSWVVGYRLAKPKRRAYYYDQKTSSVKGKTLEAVIEELKVIGAAQLEEKIKERKKQALEAQKKAAKAQAEAVRYAKEAQLLMGVTSPETAELFSISEFFEEAAAKNEQSA